MKTLTILAICFGLGLMACGESLPVGNSNNSNQNNISDPVCGNGVLEPGEVCDDGAANSDLAPNACRTNCREAGCGDGVIDIGEACDGENLAANSCVGLGYTKGALGCTADCQYDVSDCTTCGNSDAEGSDTEAVGYETCDGTDLRGMDCVMIGQASGTLACTSACTWDITGCTGSGTTCGNGIVEAGEECDDGNTDACDGCSPTCIVEECGNGVVDCGEECDDGNSSNNDACLNDCTQNVCGDGFVNPSVEQCDDGNHVLTDSCPDGPAGTCLNATCGDGFIRAGVEGCDDGNGDNTDECPDGVGGTCQPASCGDGFVYQGVENCDPAADPTCINGCQNYCGDGHVDSGEECDDSISCSDCTRFCGDGVVDTDLGEVCDDGLGVAYNGADPGSSGGGISSSCLSNCQPSSCGDGVCNLYPNSQNKDERDFCAQDCICATWNRAQCGNQCCAPGVACCVEGCVNSGDYSMGALDCGACGVNCASNQMCVPNFSGGAYCVTV